MKVKELMTSDVVSVYKNDRLSDAARVMWECDCGAVPVLDPNNNRLIGMITDRDICMAVWTKGRLPSAIHVSEVTSRERYACNQDDSIASAVELMRSRQIRRIPVLDQQDKLVGILSLADIANASQNGGARAAVGELAPPEIVATLGSICSPRPSARLGAAV